MFDLHIEQLCVHLRVPNQRLRRDAADLVTLAVIAADQAHPQLVKDSVDPVDFVGVLDRCSALAEGGDGPAQRDRGAVIARHRDLLRIGDAGSVASLARTSSWSGVCMIGFLSVQGWSRHGRWIRRPTP